MIRILKKILDKLDPPANDSVLSRFGAYEASTTVTDTAALDKAPTDEDHDTWFDEEGWVDAGPPQSGLVWSPNATQEVGKNETPGRKPRAG